MGAWCLWLERDSMTDSLTVLGTNHYGYVGTLTIIQTA